ncbi:asparagine synthase C-terminal domain-containing protein [Phenylobacterium sp.]|jgi:asparagine synthase (glutamine-hydrolysing)|uniref:asparagine synthase C-terminal domain-containing protein n=1 Tax=Phenylobacterium sp. TaxID=1871053 RepID=UPI002F93B93D
MTSRPYLVLTWRAGAANDTAAVAAGWLREAGWTLAVARRGLSAWVRPERPAPVTERSDHALVIGRWIPRAASSTHDAAPATAEARARRLCRDGFGGYVALLEDPAGGPWCAFRDPSGAVEALAWTWADLAVLASGLELAPAALRPARLALDWRVIADFVRRPVAMGSAVALDGLQGLAPGELRRVGAAAEAGVQLWTPLHWVAHPDEDPDPELRLRETVQSAVAGLLAPYGRVVVELSGGFDSSVVAAALVRAGLADRVAAALHYVGDRREADERPWAQAIAAHLGLPLQPVTRPADAAIDPAEFAPVVREARPPYAALDTARDVDSAERLQALGAEAIVTGKGGDSNFFQMPTPAVLADRLRAKGLAAFADPAGPAMARWLRRSLWSVSREALRPGPVWSGEGPGRFGGAALGEIPAAPAHPWLAGLEAAPPGKRVQVAALVGTQLSVGASRRSRVADVVQPLLAQPVMELCLSLPSWRLLDGGRDRALARRAFAGWLPEAVAWRRSKGMLTSIYARRLAAGLGPVRAYLLDGVLVGAGLLDRAAIEAALCEEALMRSTEAFDLVTACALEAWVRRWQTLVPDRPPRPRPA